MSHQIKVWTVFTVKPFRIGVHHDPAGVALVLWVLLICLRHPLVLIVAISVFEIFYAQNLSFSRLVILLCK